MTCAEASFTSKTTAPFLPNPAKSRAIRNPNPQLQVVRPTAWETPANPQLDVAVLPSAQTVKRGTVDDVLIEHAIARSTIRRIQFKGKMLGRISIEILELDDFYALQIRESRRFNWPGRNRELHCSLHTTLSSAWERLEDLINPSLQFRGHNS